MEKPLKSRLLAYLQRNHGWIASGELQRLAVKFTTHTPRSVVRRLQEMHESGELERKLIKNHAYYRAKQEMTQADMLAASQDNLRRFEGLPIT